MGRKQGCCACCTPGVSIVILVVFGIMFIIAGGVLIGLPVFDNLIHSKIKEQTPIVNGSQAYDQWHHPTSPVTMSYYFFDVQNGDDIVKGATPEVKQRGPYAYREVRYNNPLTWDDDGNELTYNEYIGYHFDTEKSCEGCTENDTITTPNVAMMALAATADKAHLSSILRITLSAIIDAGKAKLFHKLKVKEILWGYTDKILNELSKLPLPGSLPPINPFVALQHNATDGTNTTGNMTIYTGKKNVDLVQEMTKWRGEKNLTYWKTEYGNMINGSDGTHFRPFSKKSDIIYVFITDICRSLYLVYDSDISVRGIDLYRFTTDERLFANYTVNPDNIAFCVPKCYEAGILPIGQCLPANPPIMISGPHFYQGDPKLWQSFKGLKPEKEKHATFLDLEPYTGLTLEAYKRLQINLHITSVKGIRIVDGVPEMKFPIFYVEEHAKVDKADADKFKHQVYLPILLTKVLKYSLLGIGGFLVLVAVLVALFRKRTPAPYSLMHNQDAEEKKRLLGYGDDNSTRYRSVTS